jgi:hypothetical protein
MQTVPLGINFGHNTVSIAKTAESNILCIPNIMNINYINESCRQEWEKLTKQNPASGFMQSFWWTEFQNLLGWDTYKIGIFRNKHIIGGAIVAKYNHYKNNSMIFIPEGPVPISGMNKQTRLEMATPYIRQGKVLFPRQGAESLISQIVNFGIEKHDDLVDAFTIIILKILESDRPTYKSTEPLKPPRDEWGIDPFTGEYRNLSAPITAGMLDMVF